MKERKLFKKCLLLMALAGLCMMIQAVLVFVGENTEVRDFLGYYLCGVEDPGEYGNPESFSLVFNGEGNLERYSSMYYATVGSSTRYEYTDISLRGNTLVCKYDRAYGDYEIRDGGRAGEHVYTLNADGNIESDGVMWYRYEAEKEASVPESGVLRTVTDVDFADGIFSDQATFLGVKDLKRCEIKSIQFLGSLDEKPEQSWDVSAAKDGSVQLWVDESGGNVFIAAEGGVKANPDSSNLFRCCTSLTQTADWGELDVSDVTDFSYMFCDCSALTDASGVGSWDTASASTMKAIFRGCGSLKQFGGDSFAMDNVTDLSEMFRDCSALETLQTESWHYSDALVAEDTFTGTKWEGSSPLLESCSADIMVGYLLNTDILQDRLKLRAQLLMAYDEALDEFGDNPTFYSLTDLNGDTVPEMVVRENLEDDGNYTFSVYSFNLVSCKAQRIGEKIWASWPVTYWYPQEQILSCDSGSGGSCVLMMEKGRLYEIWDYELPETDRETLDYTYLWPEKIDHSYFSFPDTEDETEQDVSIRATKKDNGNYNYLAIYVDGQKAYQKVLSGQHSQITSRVFSQEEDDGRIHYIYLRVGADSSNEYTALLEYQNGQFEETVKLEDLIEEGQLFEENYFEVSDVEDSIFRVTFYLNPYALGRNLQFSAWFWRDANELHQVTYVAEIENTWSMSANVTAEKQFDAYTTVSGEAVAFTVNKGEAVQYDKLWLSDGLIWIRIKNASGEKGWIPAGNKPVFKELMKYADDETGWWANRTYRRQYFKMKLPDASELHGLANAYVDENDYDTAAIYYELIQNDRIYGAEAQGFLQNRDTYQKENPPENDVTAELGEMEIYATYLEENWLDEDVTCAAMDLDNDGEKELLIHYNNTDANCELYKADTTSGAVTYMGQIAYAHYDLYWSEKYEKLVMFTRSAGSETYNFYQINNGTPAFDFGVSFTEFNDVDRRITKYHYFSEDENYELGSYELPSLEEEDAQAKAEASKKYREYLEDMVLIEFSPVIDFIWENESVNEDQVDMGSDENIEEMGQNSQEGENTQEDYIIADSDSRYLSVEEVESFDSEKIQMVINEIYARHGRVFKTQEVAAYFQEKSWYHPDDSKTDEQIVSEFNEYEKANVDLLLQY